MAGGQHWPSLLSEEVWLPHDKMINFEQSSALEDLIINVCFRESCTLILQMIKR